MTASFDRRLAERQTLQHQDIGYLLTAYADGQLAQEGVMWVEEQLDRTPNLRTKLKEIRHLQAGLRSAFAGGAPAFTLDLPRRDALLVVAAKPSRKRKLYFPTSVWIGLAASIIACVSVFFTLVVPRYKMNEHLGVQATDGDGRPWSEAGGALASEYGARANDDQKRAEAKAWKLYESDRTNEAARKHYLEVRGEWHKQFDKENAHVRMEKLERVPEQELHKSLTPQNEALVYPEDWQTRRLQKTQESIAAIPAVVVPPQTMPPMLPSPPLEQEKDAQILERPTISVFNGQLAQGKLDQKLADQRTASLTYSGTLTTPVTQPQKPAGLSEQIPLNGFAPGRVTNGISLINVPWEEKTTSVNDSSAEVAKGREEAVASPRVTESAFAAIPSPGASSGMFGDRSNGRPRALAKGGGVVEKEALGGEGRKKDSSGLANKLNAPLEEKTISEDDSSAEVAKGREEAVASVETGSTGAFMAIGAGSAASGKFTRRSSGSTKAKESVEGISNEKSTEKDKAAQSLSLTDSKSEEEIKALRETTTLLANTLEATRQSNSEKTHIAQVAQAVAFQLNVKLAEIEDDYNNATASLAQQQKELAKSKIIKSMDELNLAQLKGPYPKSYNEKAPEKTINGLNAKNDGKTKKSYRILNHSLMQNFPGPDLAIPEPGGVGGRLLPPITPDANAGVNELIEIIKTLVAPDSWDKNGTSIEMFNGQLSVINTEDVQRQVEELLTTLRKQNGSRAFDLGKDPVASMAFLRSDMTTTLAEPMGSILSVIGGGDVVFKISSAAEAFLSRPGNVSMNREPVAHGIVRLVRSAGMQMRLHSGVVEIDVAQRPLSPTDAQGLEVSAFKDLFGTSPMQNIAVDPVQTVAIDADTASYSYAKARIAAGQEIDPTTIKPEHFINAMPMDYPPAQGPEAFSLYAEAAPSPFARAQTAWGPRTALVSIGAVAKPARADERRPLALTLAVDCSGSMAQPGALARVKLGLQTMTRHLRADDRVAIVAFGDQARVVLPSTPGNDQRALLAALDGLTTGGATNASEGLTLAYQMAAETAVSGVESRVLLATDGGTVSRADELLHRVTAFKDRGITLVVVGCGETYHAGPLQELATKGDGQHYFIGSDDEAEKLFSTTLLPDKIAVLAKDAKLQVTWNPQRVSHARLIGYDQRRLATKDFRNNAVDAGELSQDTQVTALFEVLLVDGGTGQLGTAAVRYHDTRRQQVRELACPLPGSILASQPSDRLRLLACAAATAEWLQRGWWSNVHLITPAEIATQLGRCPQPIAAELKAMIR